MLRWVAAMTEGRVLSWWRRRTYRCCRTWTPHYVVRENGVLLCANSGRPVIAPASTPRPF